MLDALNRAQRYRELAEGCRRLASIALSTETRNHLCGWQSITLLRGILPKSIIHKAQVLRFSMRAA